MNGYPHLTSCRASTSRTFATISPSAQENCAGRVSRQQTFCVLRHATIGRETVRASYTTDCVAPLLLNGLMQAAR